MLVHQGVDRELGCAMLQGTQYTILNQLPIEKPLGDNCTSFQFFC